MEKVIEIEGTGKIIISKDNSKKIPIYKFKYYDLMYERLSISMSIKAIGSMIIALNIPANRLEDQNSYGVKGENISIINNKYSTTIRINNVTMILTKDQKNILLDSLISLL